MISYCINQQWSFDSIRIVYTITTHEYNARCRQLMCCGEQTHLCVDNRMISYCTTLQANPNHTATSPSHCPGDRSGRTNMLSSNTLLEYETRKKHYHVEENSIWVDTQCVSCAPVLDESSDCPAPSSLLYCVPLPAKWLVYKSYWELVGSSLRRN